MVEVVDLGVRRRAVWGERHRAAAWPLHDIVITNIAWCMAYTREVGGGVVY